MARTHTKIDSSSNRFEKDTEHYFLLCHTYDANRRTLLNSVNAILLPHGLINLSNKELRKSSYMAMTGYDLI